jgi:hypothetical protein
MTASLRGVHLKGFQHNPSGQFACEPVCLESFELEPSTSYRQVGYGRCDGRCKLSLQVPKRRRQKWRSLELASATAALQQNALQHDCFAALGAQIRKSLRNHMMGWPADVRRFLAGAFAGGHHNSDRNRNYRLGRLYRSRIIVIEDNGKLHQGTASPSRLSSALFLYFTDSNLLHAGAISKTATAPIESVRMQIMTGSKVHMTSNACIPLPLVMQTFPFLVKSCLRQHIACRQVWEK